MGLLRDQCVEGWSGEFNLMAATPKVTREVLEVGWNPDHRLQVTQEVLEAGWFPSTRSICLTSLSVEVAYRVEQTANIGPKVQMF